MCCKTSSHLRSITVIWDALSLLWLHSRWLLLLLLLQSIYAEATRGGHCIRVLPTIKVYFMIPCHTLYVFLRQRNAGNSDVMLPLFWPGRSPFLPACLAPELCVSLIRSRLPRKIFIDQKHSTFIHMNAIDDDPRRDDDDYCTELCCCCRNHKRPRQHISAFTTYASIMLVMYSFAFYGHRSNGHPQRQWPEFQARFWQSL